MVGGGGGGEFYDERRSPACRPRKLSATAIVPFTIRAHEDATSRARPVSLILSNFFAATGARDNSRAPSHEIVRKLPFREIRNRSYLKLT